MTYEIVMTEESLVNMVRANLSFVGVHGEELEKERLDLIRGQDMNIVGSIEILAYGGHGLFRVITWEDDLLGESFSKFVQVILSDRFNALLKYYPLVSWKLLYGIIETNKNENEIDCFYVGFYPGDLSGDLQKKCLP